MKDFAASYEQRSWQYATQEYERAKRALAICESYHPFSNRRVLDYWQERIDSLEKEYPQLKD